MAYCVRNSLNNLFGSKYYTSFTWNAYNKHAAHPYIENKLRNLKLNKNKKM